MKTIIFVCCIMYIAIVESSEPKACNPNNPKYKPASGGGSQWINCTKPNECYSCGSACQNECKTLGEVCPILNIRCNDACYCIKGYARNAQEKCIPESQCPPKRK
ncbi:unnamed protein product [Acanthoscelides obtectus]|uniref:TIL domain-containing protein n=1 Tax=Acanthoscelides obtectus TaxID=200917 RepID=A0A9P0LLA1_ACAOB|nr:unnamed protein product [Acanthoscelides obtectus]CAK1630222.1 Inducible metalloproteinase inhibitor protein [Acanthoscelides obtectus]